MDKKNQFTYTVYYENTDSSGFAYHTTYLEFAERARSEILSSHFPDVISYLKSNTFFFVIKELSVNFLKPSFLFDKLTVMTKFEKNTAASIKLKQIIFNRQNRICEISVHLAWIDGKKKKPCKIPKNIISRFKLMLVV